MPNLARLTSRQAIAIAIIAVIAISPAKARAQADPANAHLQFVRLRTPAQVAEFTRRARDDSG